MAFDYGETRIGVAIGNLQLKIPHPLETITGKNKTEKFEKIRKLIDKWRPTYLVLGIPSEINPDFINDRVYNNPPKETTHNEQKENLLNSIRKFGGRLKNEFKLQIEFINEDYSSSIAAQKLNEQSIRGIMQKPKLDALAACVILQFYFNTLNGEELKL